MKKIWTILVGILSVTGAMAILLAVLLGFALTQLADMKPPALPKNIVLDIDLNQGVIDQPPAQSPFHAFAKSHGALHLQDVVEALDGARIDPRVSAVNLRLGMSEMGLGQAQEIRAALSRFKSSGKYIQSFAESFGEFGGGTIDAYIASSADAIWMQPSGDMGITGFSAQVPFVRGSLDLLGIKPEFQRRHEYKSAVETFTEKTMTAESRASIRSLLDSFMLQVTTGLAEGRKLPPDAVRRLIDQAPLGAQEALEAKLIDHLGYEDEADDAMNAKFPDAEFVDVADYLNSAERLYAKGKNKIAVIHAQGPVVSGSGSGQPFDGSQMTVAGEIQGAIADALDDEDVAAIILRIDSPGGSYLASDTIWRAVAMARQEGKPVIASIGGMAASGGYFIAMGADRIVAAPGAITGSIGVFAGKMVMADFLAKLGLSFDEVDVGANAGLLSMNRSFTPAQQAKMTAMLDRIYDDFTTKAGLGRKMDQQAMDGVARGRIFTGEQALKAGLIDELGGFQEALIAAKRAAKLADDAKVQLVYLPKPLSPLEKLASILDSGELPLGLESLARLGVRLEAIAAKMGLAQSSGLARMPPLKISD
ncbi:Protease(Signal peptide peptidase) [Rhodospirillaceae bacterium LM-1]|nr:Protease(Signal peptide peptidase) [Rhodospirillaceae bacterium LM-1]